MLEITPEFKIPLREFSFTFARSGGPGGQNVNKVNSKATLHWPVMLSGTIPEAVRQRFLRRFRHRVSSEGDVVIVSQRFRDAGRNVADCLEKLRAMLVEAAKTPTIRRATKPTLGSKRRRLESKRRRAEKKQGRSSGGWDGY